MEGMPRFAPIIPDGKKPASDYDEDFVYSLKEYILLHFQADPSDFDSAINELRSMKQEIMKCHIDVEAVCILKRYFAQLLMMKNRFPMEQGGAVKANFTWYERALEMPTAQSYSDINFEMACVMYQIGAIHASIAGMENRQSDDSIKNAFMHFQYAAWPFQYIRDNMDVAAFATSDFDKDLLTFHVNVLLGQAQECLLEKSLLDSKRSPLTVVKLATYLRDLYSMCHNLLRNSNAAVEMLSSKRFKLWTRTVAVKSEVYGSIAMLYMGYKEEQEQHFGNRLAWCQAADHYLTRALKIPGCEAGGDFADTLGFVRDVVKGRLENAKKENDFIYHERVPKFEDLILSVQGEGKVRTRAFDPLDPSIGGDDIFGSLVPPTVLASVSLYEEEKAKLKREVLSRVCVKDEELKSLLGSLNASELGLSAGPSFIVPEILLERNAAMHTQNDAVPRVLEKLQLVDQLARDADSQLNALSARLKGIDLPAFTEDDGYKAITAEINKLSEHQAKARSLNAELHKALAAHSTNIHLLSLPLRELTEKIAPQTSVTPAQTKEGEALIKVLDKAHEMQSQRAMLLDTFSKELEADNISKKLLAERDTDNQSTFAAELKKHEKTIQYINANLAAQEKILHLLTEANADFAEQRKVIQESNKERFDQVMTLVAAYDIYMDVSNKAQDGKKFYEKLLQRVGNIGKAVEAIEAAFNKEREKLEGERRAVEEKKAAMKAARDAQDALNDFGGLPLSSLSQLPSGSSSTGRPRLGDYMQFYKNKMAAKGGSGGLAQPLTSMQAPPQLNMPSDNMAYRQLPSPAPSSIAGDFHGDGGGFNPEYSASRQSYISPVPPSHSSQMMPEQFRQYQGYHPGGQPTQQYAIVPPPPRQHQQYPPSSRADNGYQFGPFPPAPSLPNGFDSSHSSSSELNRIMNNGTPSVPPTPAPTQIPTPQRATPEIQSRTPQQNGQTYEMYQPQAPQLPQQQGAHNPYAPHGQPLTQQPPHSLLDGAQHHPPAQQYHQPPPPQQYQQPGMFQSAPLPPQSALYNGQQHQLTGQLYQSQLPQPPQPQVSNAAPQMPMPMAPQTQQSQFSQQQIAQPRQPQHPQPQHSLPPTFPSVASASPQLPMTPQLQQQQTPQQPQPQDFQLLQPHQSLPSAFPPVASVSPHPATPAFQYEQSQPIVPQSGPQAAPQPPGQQPVAPPVTAATWNMPFSTHQSAPWGAPTPHNQAAPSPWHNTARASPWHQQQPPPNFATASTAQPIQREMPVLGQGTSQSNGQPAPNRSSNLDLLSSLLGDLHLPPAMAPSQPQPRSALTEHYSLQQTAPTTAFRPLQDQPTGTVIRPAAAVIPIQQKAPQSDVADVPVLSMVQTSTISVAPQAPAALADLTNPDKFNLGESDKHRLEKRQLHAAIKGNGPMPSMDPLDPLNQLDPFWGVKKT